MQFQIKKTNVGGQTISDTITIQHGIAGHGAELNRFIEQLDEVTFYARFPKIYPSLARNRENAKECLETAEFTLAFDKSGKLAGFVDYEDKTSEGKPKVVACINMVLDPKYHGTGLARILGETNDACLREEGYLYKMGGVETINEGQHDRLLRGGWKETQDSIDNPSELREYWKALDQTYRDVEPEDAFPGAMPRNQSSTW